MIHIEGEDDILEDEMENTQIKKKKNSNYDSEIEINEQLKEQMNIMKKIGSTAK